MTTEYTDCVVRTAIESLKNDFFICLQGDMSTLGCFLDSWTAFEEALCSSRERLQAETLDMVFTFATTVSTIASSMLDLEQVSGNVYRQFSTDISNLITEGVKNLAVGEIGRASCRERV